MADPILKRNYEHPLATTFNGFATQDKVGGITERFGPDQVFAALDEEGFARAEDIPALSGERPQDLGTAGSGTSDDVSRADHRHQMPTAAQVGAAPASHGHVTSQVTGLDTALASKEPGLGTPGVTSFLRSTAAGVRAWVQLVATDITDLGTVLTGYLTKNNPAFTGILSGPLAKIGGGGGTSPSTATPFVALATSGFCTLLAQTGSGDGGANHGASSSNGSWYWGIRDDGASGSPVGCWAINDPSDVRVWGTPAGMWIRGALDVNGTISQTGTPRITAAGGFRGTNLRLTDLVAGSGKFLVTNDNGEVLASDMLSGNAALGLTAHRTLNAVEATGILGGDLDGDPPLFWGAWNPSLYLPVSDDTAAPNSALWSAAASKPGYLWLSKSTGRLTAFDGPNPAIAGYRGFVVMRRWSTNSMLSVSGSTTPTSMLAAGTGKGSPSIPVGHLTDCSILEATLSLATYGTAGAYVNVAVKIGSSELGSANIPVSNDGILRQILLKVHLTYIAYDAAFVGTLSGINGNFNQPICITLAGGVPAGVANVFDIVVTPQNTAQNVMRDFAYFDL